jgi:NitT/TauT family transport system substrate-binding protein
LRIPRLRSIFWRAKSRLIDTAEARELGIGDVSDAKLKSAISAIATAFELPRVPSLGDVFDRSFLPAKADRIPPTVAP